MIPQESFYLGREYDLEKQAVLNQPVQYDSHDMTTHAVVVGMTGSGKTGLCITLLEEAALHGIPSIIVDLKGDLSNLLLQFPQMKPENFQPWVDPDAARRQNLSIEEYADHLAQSWQQGLKESGLGPERIEQLQKAADWRIYTPGSEAGLPVSVVENFAVPKNLLNERELLHNHVESTATALLGLTNVSVDPVQSREHILISNLLLNAWTEGRDLDLPHLINEITNPPLRKIGAFDIDMFYPEEDRLRLALTLNNLLASPSFSGWITGEQLNLSEMMYGPDGKPRQLIFYLAHLDEGGRMFFLTLLLEEMLTWTRSQPGSSSLRALLYLDEVFGYLPPYPANPPTKRPLMTLLKQARAFGVGVLLATQNPMDLDYKALTNAGTWFIGKLQTDRDKARLVEGLQGVAAEQGTLTDSSYLDTAISSLGNQVFLLHNVHEGKPRLFHTRHALSYLYGPMTRDHVAQLMAPYKGNPPQGRRMVNGRVAEQTRECQNCHAASPLRARFCMECGTPFPAEPAPTTTPQTEELAANVPISTDSDAADYVPPVLPPGLTQFFLPAKKELTAEELHQMALRFEPRLLGFAEVTFRDRKSKLEYQSTYRLLAPAPSVIHTEPWTEARAIPASLLETSPFKEALWEEVPASINDPKKLRNLEKAFGQFLFSNAALTIYHNRALGLLSRPEENRDTFLARCQEAAQEAAQNELAEWEKKPQSPDTSTASEAQEAPAPGASQAPAPSPTGNGASPPNPNDPRWQKKRQARLEKLLAKWQERAQHIREIILTPRKTDIRVTHFGLAWAPYRCLDAAHNTWDPVFENNDVPPDRWRTSQSKSEPEPAASGEPVAT